MPWVVDPSPRKLLLSGWGLGLVPLQWSDRFFQNGKRYYFQRTNWGLRIRRLGTNLADPTAARLVQREKMQVARDRWAALSDVEKAAWRARSECHWRRLSGYHVFISWVLKGKV